MLLGGAAGFRAGGQRAPEQKYYFGQAGWDGYEWGGVTRRFYFVTADWAEVDPAAGGAVYAGRSEGELPPSSGAYITAAGLRSMLPDSLFAGVVCARAD